MRMPFASAPSSKFGRRWLVLPGRKGFWNMHTGIDWPKAIGTAVRAAATGTVIENSFDTVRGHQLAIQHDDGVVSRYHMLAWKSPLRVGQTVTEGAVVGAVGQSGSAATGPHLHFEILDKGTPVDPLEFLATISSAATAQPFRPSIKGAPEMRVIRVVQPSGTTYALVGATFFQRTNDVAQANRWAETWGDSQLVSTAAFDEAYRMAVEGIKAVQKPR